MAMTTEETIVEPPRPTALSVLLDNIPSELRALRRWVAWRYDFVEGRWTKVPYIAGTNRKASSTNAETWCDWATAVRAYRSGKWDGIGFVFGNDVPYVGVDLDKCLSDDPFGSELAAWAIDVLASLDSYSEISASNTGIKTLCKGRVRFPLKKDKKDKEGNSVEKDGARRDGIEVYRAGRFFSLTGRIWQNYDTTINERSTELQTLIDRLTASKSQAKSNGPHYAAETLPFDELDIIDRARGAKNGAKFSRLWGGDTGDYGGDDSRADLALCGMLAFWCGPDEARIDRLFRQSGLLRAKWERDDYRGETIRLAIEGRNGEFFKANGRFNGHAHAVGAVDSRQLPRIDAGDHELSRVTTAAWDAIEAANEPPFVFRHAGLPARIELDDHGTPMICTLDEDRLRHVMARSAEWFREKTTGRGENKETVEVPAMPPRDVVRDA
ncbi:MAG: hypothetical protein SGJ19_07870, partial [Planctomycetia bacterium]|nr:hypothetical protein [Planctomycetia bacterium]